MHRVGERLHLDQQWPLPFDGGYYGRAGHAGAAIGEEQLTRVGHGNQPCVGHFEQTEFAGWAEPML